MLQNSFIHTQRNVLPDVELLTLNIFFHFFLNFEDSKEQNELEIQFQ